MRINDATKYICLEFWVLLFFSVCLFIGDIHPFPASE